MLFHSDQKVQYYSCLFREKLNKYGIIQSISRRRNRWNNAVLESFFHSLKIEEIYQKTFKNREEAKKALFEYVKILYNRKKHSTLGYVSPNNFK